MYDGDKAVLTMVQYLKKIRKKMRIFMRQQS